MSHRKLDSNEEERFEARLEDYLVHLADGGRPDLEARAAELEDPARQRAFRVAALAEEFLLRASEGAAVRLQDFRGRLPDEAARRELDQYLHDSRRAGRFLPSSLAPGTAVGKYTIERELGRGGTAVVYSALDPDLDRQVAIKVVNRSASSPADHERWEESVRTESRTLAALKSRNIVTVYEVERGAESSYIVMDLIPGRSAAQVLQRLRDVDVEHGTAARVEALRELLGPRPAGGDYEDILDPRSWYRTVARILARMVAALERAHEKGIHHRDLKPGNVMLLGGGEPVLLDFGMAANAELCVEDEGLHGTPGYMAPEQIRSLETGRDERTDLYKVGLVLYELLTLRPAFEHRPGQPLMPLLGRIQAGAYDPPDRVDPRIPPALQAICAKALAADPDRRYAKAGELRADLERFERRLPPRHAEVPRATSLRMRAAYVARSRWTGFGALVAAVLLASFLWKGGKWGWGPPAMEAFAVAERAQHADPLASGQVLDYPGAFALGVTVSANAPTLLYAFSVFGEREDELFVRAVTPERYGSLEPPAEGSPRPLRVEPGEHRITCAFVTGEASPLEGLLVYACREESPVIPVIETWQARVQQRELESDGLFPMTWAEAKELGGVLFGEGARGESGARIGAAERRNLFADLRDTEAEGDWRELGFKRELFTFAVARR